jgi:hypothetical protein
MFKWLFGKTRDEEFMLNMMKAAAEGDTLHRLRQAVATISIEGVEGTDATERAGVAAALVTRAIAEKARSGIIDDDDRFVTGTFAFVLSNYFSFLVAGNFELASIRAVLKLLGADEFHRCFNTIQESYNRNAASKSLGAIGKTTEVWFKNPSSANFERLVQLFKLLRGHVSPNQGAIKPAEQQEDESRTFSNLLHDTQLIPRYYRLIEDLISFVLDVPNLSEDNELKFNKAILEN